MSIVKKILMGSSLIAGKLCSKNIPLIVNWAITGNCNLRCKHCYGSYGVIQKSQLDFNTCIKIIDEIKMLGGMRITIEGGEPLIRDDIDEIIRYIKRLGIENSLCTNGILLEKHIEVLKENTDLVVFSIDGRAEHHDYLRGKNNFHRVVESISLAKKNKVNTLIFFTIMDINIEDIDYVLDLGKELNTPIAFNIAVSKLDIDSRVKLPKLDSIRYRNAIRKIMEKKKQGFPVYYSDRNFLNALYWDDYACEYLYERDRISKAIKNPYLIPCAAGKYFCYIEANGDLYPCYQRVGELKVMNVVKHGFKNAFNHLSEIELCRYCYNITLSELNLQSNLNPFAMSRLLWNYIKQKK